MKEKKAKEETDVWQKTYVYMFLFHVTKCPGHFTKSNWTVHKNITVLR